MKFTSKPWSHRLAAALMVVATISPLVVGVSVMEGCKKKAPPPPAPVLPPPPPVVVPDPIDFKAVAQTMKADRRVGFAPGATTTKQSLAEAIVALADGLARGDDKKFSSNIDPASRNHVKSLVASGQWAEQTKKIEAVRIVRIMDGAESTPVEATPGVGGDIKDAMFGLLMKNLPDPAKEEIKKELGREPTSADLSKIIEIYKGKMDEMKAAGLITEEQAEASQKGFDAFDAMTAKEEKKPDEDKPSESASGMFTVTLAVQEPGAAIAIGWIAVEVNGKWTFKASDAIQQANQRRASDFDALFNTDAGSRSNTDTPADAPAPSSGKPTGG